MAYIRLADLRVVSGADKLTCYTFNTGVAKHHFCRQCGIHLFHQTRSDPDAYGINVATLDGVRPYEDFSSIPVHDGRHHALDSGEQRIAGILRFEHPET